MSPYLLWDWNGTLLDDTRACLDALNVLLARRRLPAFSFGNDDDSSYSISLSGMRLT